MKTATRVNAIQMLKDDHKKVKELFSAFEKAKDSAKKQKIADAVIEELEIHSAIEEEIFYPAVREQIKDDGLMNEAGEEHHVVEVLIGELEEMTAENERFDAKFTVLAENVRHHIKEEESKILPGAKKTDLDMDELGNELLRKKEELKGAFVPAPMEIE